MYICILATASWEFSPSGQSISNYTLLSTMKGSYTALTSWHAATRWYLLNRSKGYCLDQSDGRQTSPSLSDKHTRSHMNFSNIFITLSDCTDDANKRGEAGMFWTQGSGAFGAKQTKEGESGEADSHTWLQLVDSIKDTAVWNKLYISQLKGIFKTSPSATERSHSLISPMNKHCATYRIYTKQQRKPGMSTHGGQ